MNSVLFQPFRLHDLTVPNRIVLSPMTRSRARAARLPNRLLADYYTQRSSAVGNDPNAAGNHRKRMVQALDASLKRLKTDYIDLYWLHIWDQITPIEEVMRAFDDLVRLGKILYLVSG